MFLKLFNKKIDVKRINLLNKNSLTSSSIQIRNFSNTTTKFVIPGETKEKKKKVVFKRPKYAEKPKDFKFISKEKQNIPDKFREYFDSQQLVDFGSNSGFFGLKELSSVESLKEEHKKVLEKLGELQKMSVSFFIFFFLFFSNIDGRYE